MNSSTTQTTSAVKGGSSATATPANTNMPRKSSGDQTGRRGSGNGGMFENLANLKRNSQDMQAQARRSSLSEQTTKPGFIGKMWNDFTKGSN